MCEMCPAISSMSSFHPDIVVLLKIAELNYLLFGFAFFDLMKGTNEFTFASLNFMRYNVFY